MNEPAVSVIMPVYNRAALLRRAVESVLAQSMPDFELIIVDDGSTDDSLEVARALSESDRRIVVVEYSGPHGPGAARNAGLARARAAWVAFLDSDDVWMPDTLARYLEVVAEDVALIGGDYRMADGGSGGARTMKQFVFETMLPWWESHPFASRVIDCARLRRDPSSLGDRDMIRAMALGNYLWPTTSAVMVNRALTIEVGGFPPHMKRTEDMVLWMKLVDKGRCVFVDHVVSHQDVGGRDQGTDARYAGYDRRRRHTAYEEACWHLRFVRSLPERMLFDEAKRAFWRDRMAALHRICGHHALVLRKPLAATWHYALALTGSPFQRKMLKYGGRDFFRRPW